MISDKLLVKMIKTSGFRDFFWKKKKITKIRDGLMSEAEREETIKICEELGEHKPRPSQKIWKEVGL